MKNNTSHAGDQKPQDLPPAEQNKRRRRRRPLSILLDLVIVALVAAGLYLLIKPWYNRRQQDRKSQEIMAHYAVATSPQIEITFRPDEFVVPGEALEDWGEEPEQTTATSGAEEPEPTIRTKFVGVTVEGILKVDKINLTMPIATEASVYALRVAIGHYRTSAAFGDPGYAILFGHRMNNQGRHFNRLPELRAGDEVQIESHDTRYTYVVDKYEIIPAKNLLARVKEKTSDKRLLMITCDPATGHAPNRWLVYGSLRAAEPLN